MWPWWTTEDQKECLVRASNLIKIMVSLFLRKRTGSGKRAGYANLDAIRAIKQSGNFTGIDPDPIVTSYGYSGGTWAAAWVCNTNSMTANISADCWIF
jgi:hypothetical protein